MDLWILNLVHSTNGGILLYLFITTVTAGILSMIIGLERQLQGEAAGIRTHALIAIASSFLMSINIWAIRMADGTLDIVNGTITGDLNYDTSRIAAAAVTGIGFLGAGVIFKEKFTVRGLATASTLWICTAIGLACGAGFVLGACITAVVVLITLISLAKVIDFIEVKSPAAEIVADGNYPLIETIRSISEKNGFPMKKVHITKCDDESVEAHVSFHFRTDPMDLEYFCRRIKEIPEVREAVTQNTRLNKRLSKQNKGDQGD